jgi:hypothetical protein
MAGQIIGYNKLAEAGFTPNLGGVSWEETRGLPGSDRIRYDTGSGQYSFKGKPSSTGAYKSIAGITPEAFKRGMSLAMFYNHPDRLLATALGGETTSKDIRSFSGYDDKAIIDMMTSPSYSLADGWSAIKEGWASDGMSGMFGALFSAEGSGLLGLGTKMISGLFSGYTAKRDKEKARKDAQVIGGKAPMGFNLFTDKGPEAYLSGEAQKEQGVGNYYNPKTLPYQMKQASSPGQGMLSQQNQSMVQPGSQGLLGNANQKRLT